MAQETWDIDIQRYSSFAGFPSTGETDKIYADTQAYDLNPDAAILFYKWDGTAYEQFHPAPRPRPH